MKIAKRLVLFLAVNALVLITISVVTSLLGISGWESSSRIQLPSLVMFCALWGFGGAFISLGLSRVMAKWMMGVKVIAPDSLDSQESWLVQKIHDLSRLAGLRVMPEVGVYESQEMNAFATGPTKNRSLVAVSSGLLTQMNPREIEGVLAHEVAHIANGDMVTMTLVQGVVNSFVLFLSRVISFVISQSMREEMRSVVQMVCTIALDIVLTIAGSVVVAAFSRHREYRADAQGAALAGTASMVAALEALQRNATNHSFQNDPDEEDAGAQAALASMKISGRPSRWLSLFSTHPPLEMRIQRLLTHTS